MEEDAFSTSLSSLSTLSPQSNFQSFVSVNYSPSQQQQSQTNSTNGGGNLAFPDIPENCPYVIFYFRSNNQTSTNGELYDERRILLDKPCKIGRSVAKVRPEPSNGIFDCKVLSRNHALLWQENGKVIFFYFYLDFFFLNSDFYVSKSNSFTYKTQKVQTAHFSTAIDWEKAMRTVRLSNLIRVTSFNSV
jgi:hypothetical protein